ncbi:MAG: cellulase family glycosylhydrolase [Candidatus Hydrogenedentes bacterium]|nr:cellulase family glycosylhydrolase [Candidatus Hydrogenedentota bacterium]
MRIAIASSFLIALVAALGCGKSVQPTPDVPPPTEKPVVVPETTTQEATPQPPPVAVIPPKRSPFVSVKDGAFIDSEGRQLLLHGMAVISKDPKENYQSWHGPEDFAQMRRWGMNCIRLGIIWDGLEPEPGKFDEEYLKKVDQRIEWARDNKLYVFLDMHQDLFSVKYSDGAPEWATLDEGLPHTTGAVWSDSYQLSAAVKKSFDNFWANKPGPDGVGVQERFALAWQHVAKRYADNPTVIGYDLFNEPNEGSGIPDLQILMASAFAEAMAAKDGTKPDVLSVASKWMDPKGRSELMTRLQDIDIFTKVVDAPQEAVQAFERAHVVPMFQRVANAIREVDTNHILFLETLMACNMGIRTGLEPLMGPDGQRDPLQAYAPHGYDIVVDTPDLTNASNERVKLIFDRHAESGKRLNMPVLIGEWGAYGGAGPAIVPTAEFTVREFERHGFSDTFWEYGRYVKDAAYLPALHRAIPLHVAGSLVSYGKDPGAGSFLFVWNEDPAITAPTQIFMPEDEKIDSWDISGGPSVSPEFDQNEKTMFIVPPQGKAAEVQLKMMRKPS